MKIILAIISLAIFGIFLTTIPPTVYIGDSGEISAAAYTLGISHPPGYPLYMLLGKIASFVPVGDMAFRINMLAAFLAIMVFLALYKSVVYAIKITFEERENSSISLTAIVIALVYMFSYIFWFEAINAKGGIYVLTILAEILCIYYCVRFTFERGKKHLYISAYIAGLLPALHHTTGLITFFVIVALIVNFKDIKTRSKLTAMAMFLFSFTTPYLYLFIRVKAAPAICWGDINTAGQVVSHILRRVYYNFPFIAFTSETEFFKLKNYILQYWVSYKFAFVFVLVGLIVLYNKKKGLFFAAGLFIVLNILALFYFTGNSFSPASIYMNSGFYLIVDIITLIIAGMGLYRLAGFISDKAGIKMIYCVMAALILPVILIFTYYGPDNLSRRYLAYDYAENMLRTLNSKDFLFADEDEAVFNLLYLQYVKGLYRDIKTFDRLGNFLDTSIYKEAKDANIKVVYRQGNPNEEKYNAIKLRATEMLERKTEMEIYNNNPARLFYASFDEFQKEKMESRPYGIIFKLYKENEKITDTSAMMRLCTIRDYYYNKGYDFFSRSLLARYFLQYARYAAIKKDEERFQIYLSKVEELAYDSPVILNLISSIYYYDLKEYQTAIEYMERIMKIDPYDFKSLEVLINMCLSYAPEKAIDWLRYYYYRTNDEEKKDKILILISKVRDAIANKANTSKTNK